MKEIVLMEVFDYELTNPATQEAEKHHHTRPHHHVISNMHPTLTLQEPGKLIPTQIIASICEDCGMVFAEIKR